MLLLILSFAAWLLLAPHLAVPHVPAHLRQLWDHGGTPALLLGFVLVPALYGILGFGALVTWVVLSSRILPRDQLERLIGQDILGGSLGRFESWLLDGLYAERR